MLNKALNSEAEFIELTTNDIDITSKLNIHSCSVSEYLKDLRIPYDDIPVEIIALITKFYLTKSHTNDDVNADIKSSIPSSCSLQNANPWPTKQSTKSQSRCRSCHSFLPIPQFLAEIALWAAVISLPYAFHIIVIGIFVVIGIIAGYCFYLSVYLKNFDRIMIAAPISDANDRILSLNNIFDINTSIQFQIEGHHLFGYGSRMYRCISFHKSVHLMLNHCQTVIEPNIYNETESDYSSWAYLLEFDILFHFDDEIDRLKYIKLLTQFINNNIHDIRQDFTMNIQHDMLGLNQKGMVPCLPGKCLGVVNDYFNENHGYIVIINQRSKVLLNILKWMMRICTILCISWLYKLPFYCLMNRKKLSITKYLSIDKLQEIEEWQHDFEWDPAWMR